MLLSIRNCLVLALLGTALAAQEETAPPHPQPQLASPAAVSANEPFSVSVADRVLSNLRDAMIGHNRTQTLANFDQALMPDFAEFARDMGTLFQRYDSLIVRYRILQVIDEEKSSIAIVEFTVDAAAADDTQPPTRRTEQLRFSFGRTPKEWKVTDLQPRDFFSRFGQL